MAAFRFCLFQRVLLLGLVVSSSATAGNIWNWTYEGADSASAQLFDGGEVVNGVVNVLSVGDDRVLTEILAIDFFDFGADPVAAVVGGTHVNANDEAMLVELELLAGYSPSTEPGGEDTGGMAEWQMHSVVELTVPSDGIEWAYSIELDPDTSDTFVNTTTLVLENITDSSVRKIPVLTDHSFRVPISFFADAGDRVRLEVGLAGSGIASPGPSRSLDVEFSVFAQIPEPGALALLGVGTVLAAGRRTAVHTGSAT